LPRVEEAEKKAVETATLHKKTSGKKSTKKKHSDFGIPPGSLQPKTKPFSIGQSPNPGGKTQKIYTFFQKKIKYSAPPRGQQHTRTYTSGFPIDIQPVILLLFFYSRDLHS